jgi:hypothetical protein
MSSTHPRGQVENALGPLRENLRVRMVLLPPFRTAASYESSEKVSAFPPIQTFPSESEEPPAEGAVAFSTCLWRWVGSMLCTQHFWGIF